jgi:prepilin peptidase CpaA
MWNDIVLITILIICSITDWRSRKIYNKVIFPGLIAAFGLHLIIGGFPALAVSLIGFIVGLSLLLIPYLLGGMGAGDVKLLALVGALKGTMFVLMAAVYMALLGGLIALLVLIFRKGMKERLRSIFYFLYCLRYGVRIPLANQQDSLTATYPYGLAIAGGTLVCLLNKGWLL